jgi:hypothetical protein
MPLAGVAKQEYNRQYNIRRKNLEIKESRAVLIGEVYGRLTVLRQDGHRHGHVSFVCRCSCDDREVFDVRGDKLKAGKRKSCGCIHAQEIAELAAKKEAARRIREARSKKTALKKKKADAKRIIRERYRNENRVPWWEPGQWSFNSRLRSLSQDMQAEGIPETDILYRLNFYRHLILDNECHYCGGPLSPQGFSLDRMNNDLGHQASNVVPCCGSCNFFRQDRLSYSHMMRLAPLLKEFRLEALDAKPVEKIVDSAVIEIKESPFILRCHCGSPKQNYQQMCPTCWDNK